MASISHHSLPLPTFDKPVKVLIVAAPYYKDIADDLLAGARAVLEAAGASHELVEVPGAMEIPGAIAAAERLANYDGYVALGCVIRGETYHFEVVCNESARGLTMLGLSGAAIGNGVLTMDTYEQGAVRADPKDQDKGGGAAAAALHLIALQRRWGGTKGRIGFRPSDEMQLAKGGDTV